MAVMPARKGVRAGSVRRSSSTGVTQPVRQPTALDHERRSDLHAALTAATDNPIAQCGLIYVYANRLGCGEGDVEAVRRMILGGPTRDCAG